MGQVLGLFRGPGPLTVARCLPGRWGAIAPRPRGLRKQGTRAPGITLKP